MNYDPMTGKPLRRPSPWRRFRGQAWWVQLLGWLGAGFVGFLVLGAVVGPQKKPAATSAAAAASSPRVAGSMSKDDTFGFGDSQALAQLHVSHVYCQWNGDHVMLHARFVNRLDAHVTVHVAPTYHLANAGQHGDGEDLSVGIDPGATRDWTGDLGQPAGVNQAGIPITSCAPSVSEVDLG